MMEKNYGEFAHKLMAKHGWQQGQGLGAKRQGIVEPLKPQLKFDTTGIGHDPAKEFTHHWWDIAFNKAAKRIKVDHSTEEDVQVTLTAKKKKKMIMESKEAKSSFYSQFVKSGTLTDGKMTEVVKEINSENETDDEIEMKALSKLSDEELFKACGGLTAHKGARHGHKMSGKLKRIEAMEALILSKRMRAQEPENGDVKEASRPKKSSDPEKKRKKKKKKKTKKDDYQS